MTNFRLMPLKYENYSLRHILFSTLRQQNYIKQHETTKVSLQKLLMRAHLKQRLQVLFRLLRKKAVFLAISQSNVHFALDHPFFACPIGRASKIACPKSPVSRDKFIHP